MNVIDNCLIPAWPAPENVRTLQTTRLGGLSAAPYDSFISFPRAAWECSPGALRQVPIGAARLNPVTTRRVGTRNGAQQNPLPAYGSRLGKRTEQVFISVDEICYAC